MLTPKEKQRIEKEAEVHASIEPYEVQAKVSYYTGAFTEHSIAWNKAIDECISAIIINHHGISSSMLETLKKLKHKQP